MSIQGILRKEGYTPVPESFYSKIKEWASWYAGDVKEFHSYSVWNGIGEVECHRYSVGMAKKVCEDWANLLLNEKVNITLEGEREQAFVDSVFENNNFWPKANELQERKAALGTVAYIPTVEGMVVDGGSGAVVEGGKLRIDYCTAENIFPLVWDNGIILECAFSASKEVDGKAYTYIQLHRMGSDGLYFIENRLYLAGERVPLSSARGFERVPERVQTLSDKPCFIIDRLNIANVDEQNPMGVSVYAHAIDQLKAVDIGFDGYVNEFVLGKKRIVVQPAATEQLDGRPVFDSRETIYYVLPEDTRGTSILQQVDMALRADEFNAGLQDMLNMLSVKCGFGENHYRFDRGSVATATQVISENSTMFRTLKKHEIILEQVLIDLCRAIIRLGNSALNAGLDEDVEISIDFDDSIIEDKTSDFSRDMQLLNAGIMNDWEFRAKWMNEDEETARAALPKMADIATDEQEEVE